MSADRESGETAAILDYWLRTIGPERWWTRDAAIDADIVQRFGGLWESWRSRTPASFLGSADDALAAVILFDQFSRNMFRGHADAFSTDSLALAIAGGAIDRGYDAMVDPEVRPFLYMPFMHSEQLDDQDRSIALFTRLGDANSLDYAKRHRDLIARFGRFPHRNAVLGRADRPGETEAAAEGANW